MTQKDEFEHAVKLDAEARVREGDKAVLEEVLEEHDGGGGGFPTR